MTEFSLLILILKLGDKKIIFILICIDLTKMCVFIYFCVYHHFLKQNNLILSMMVVSGIKLDRDDIWEGVGSKVKNYILYFIKGNNIIRKKKLR